MTHVIHHGTFGGQVMGLRCATPRIAICTKCGCQFSYENHETHQLRGKPPSWDSRIAGIGCPDCSEELEVPAY
jgi:hypothetical protein